MRVTSVYRLPYVSSTTENITGQIERIRFTAIDRQLESLFTFLGDGIISGWTLEKQSDNNKNIQINKGSGVISSVAAATTGPIILDDLQPNAKNYIYAKLTATTPYTTQAEYFSSIAQFESNAYLCLGAAITDADGNISSISNDSRKELGLISQVTSIISEHVHTGSPGEPDKIDLFNHVKGVLSAANIEDINASKISSGQINRNRLKISHNDLSDKGTLSHSDLDLLIDKLQKINKILFGDIMSANLLQLMLSLKHVWQNFDDYLINFAAVIPGIGNNSLLSENSFIDTNATTAEIDYTNSRIKGMFIEANEIGQITVNSLSEWTSGIYDPEFILITDNSRAYGYGYGMGGGSEYFDVIETNFEETFSSHLPVSGFPGSLVGWGVSDITGEEDFESYFAGVYGYGYGWEYAFGFPQTLTSTMVTLNPSSSTLVVFDDIENEYLRSETDYFSPMVRDLDVKTPVLDFTFQMSNKSSDPSDKKRSDYINANTSAASDDLLSFVVGRSEKKDGGDTGYSISDISSMYSTWERPFDLTSDNYIFFSFIQNKRGGTSDQYATDFDPEWTFDHSMGLYLEFTVDDTRYIYQYREGSDSFRFVDRGVKYFEDQITKAPVNGTTPAEIILSATIVDKEDPSDLYKNLYYIGSYSVENAEVDFDVTPTNLNTLSPSESTLEIIVKNLTGVFFVAVNDTVDKYQRYQEYGPIEIVQGLRTNLSEEIIVEHPASLMPVSLNKIRMSGSVGFSSDVARNKIEDLSVTFTEPVDFTSISWIADEPSDSLIFIQVQKVSTANTYFTYPIYTNKGSVLLSRVLDDPTGLEDFPETLSGYLASGSNLPESLRNTERIKLKVVLIPSSNGSIAPTINSITINYNSQTSGGEYSVSSFDQWSEARSQKNMRLLESGKVQIFDFSRTKNLIYGGDGHIVEYEDAGENSNWTDRKTAYTGTDLPQTITQFLSNVTSRISGKVTDLKVLEDSRVAFLDRDSSRVVIVKYDLTKREYVPDVVVSSEYAWEDTVASINKPEYAETATMVKAVYNQELGDNGVLYCVFSHELKSWRETNHALITKQEDAARWNIDPTKFIIRKQGAAYDLSRSISITMADRGIVAFEVSAVVGNLLQSMLSPKIDITFDSSDTENGAVGSNSAVKFLSENIVTDISSRIFVSIEKVGRTVPERSTGNYNLIYMPIQGIVAFDIDNDDNMYFLKSRRPYSWDTDANGFDKTTEPYFGRVKIDEYWTGWDQTQDNINDTVFKELEPNYFTSNTYGSKASIEFISPFLLICISGQKQVYISQASTGASGVVYSSPESITLLNDGTYPMSAHIDRNSIVTGSSPDYGAIYIALSDLTAGGSSSSESRVIKIDSEGEILWEWGTRDINSEVNAGGFAVSVNDVRVVTYNNNSGVIIST